MNKQNRCHHGLAAILDKFSPSFSPVTNKEFLYIKGFCAIQKKTAAIHRIKCVQKATSDFFLCDSRSAGDFN
jgi:hypothetical protein